MPSSPASRRVSSSPAAGSVSESAVTSSAPSPTASFAARARKVESTPPEKATTTRFMPRTMSSSRSYLAASAGSWFMRSSEHWPGQPGERDDRPRTHVTDDLGGGQRSESCAGGQVEPPAHPVEYSRRVEIACAGRVHHRAHRMRDDCMDLAAADQHRALRAPSESRELAMSAYVPESGVEIGHLVQGADLGLVREEDVHVVLDEIEERRAVAVDAEGIR